MNRPAPFSSGALQRRGHGASASAFARCTAHTTGAQSRILAPCRPQPSTPHQQRLQPLQAAAAAVQSPTAMSMTEAMALANRTKQLKEVLPGLKADAVEPQRTVGDTGDRVALLANRDIKENTVVMVIPESLAITKVDADKHELVGPLAAESSELVALTLWLMAERAKGPASAHAAMLATMPESTLSPVLWSDKELDQLLRGSAVMVEATARKAALAQQWQALAPKLEQAKLDPAVFNEANFGRCFCVIVACTSYLPSAECFALLPLAGLMGRTGNSNGCNLDYDAAQGAVVVTSGRPYRSGAELLLNDGRPNGELLLATGAVQDNNSSDYVVFEATLVPSDRYFIMKSQIMESMGFSAKQAFPVYADRMPLQLLAYLRLGRVADPALFAKVSFEQDVELSQLNEYEILQILMGDCRERLAAYILSYEEDVKLAQQQDLTPKERVAVQLRLAEKKILNATMDAVRRRLAPIRGIPTKTGAMLDPNSDFMEIFETLESIPQAPVKLLQGFMSWARGDDDPDWGSKGKKPPPRK